MKLIKKPTVIGSFLGAFLGLVYTIYAQTKGYTSNTNVLVFLVANILYFSLLGFILAVFFNLVTDSKKVARFHIGALLGFIAFLLIVLTTSIRSTGLLCRNINAVFDCNLNEFISFMIIEGPFPLHLLQVFLILVGILIGLFIENKSLLGFKR